MKCKIMYEESPCKGYFRGTDCPFVWTECNHMDKFMARTQVGFYGEIQEYEIWNEGTERWTTIKINNRRTIRLVEDTYGRDRDTGCPVAYDKILLFEIDGKSMI